MKTDIVKEFWKRYKDADILERSEIIKKLYIVKDSYKLATTKGMTEELFQHSMSTSIQSYFDDLLDFKEGGKINDNKYVEKNTLGV